MFKSAWNKWKKVAERIGNFQITVIFSILYFVLITPIAMGANLFGDFFDLKKSPSWKAMEDNSGTIEKLKLQ